MIEWTNAIIAVATLFTALATLITSIKTRNKTVELTNNVNGHMTTLIEQTKAISKTEGIVEGIKQGVDLTKTPIITDRRGQ